MFEIDESLANVFKTKFSDKKKSSEKQQSILIFRTRFSIFYFYILLILTFDWQMSRFDWYIFEP